MGLKALNLKTAYYSDEDNLLVDFYIPVLSTSIKYDRIAGYFCSNSLAVAAKGIAGFINNGGRIRLIANVVLSVDDQEAIKEALLKKEEEVLAEIDSLEDELKKDHIKMLAWMLKKDLLEIKIAVVENGIEHQKIGILEDANDNVISFNGSDNETMKGWLYNDEQFHVFCDWKNGDNDHLLLDLNRFTTLWEDKGKKVKVYNISDAFKKGLVCSAPDSDEEFRKLSLKIAESGELLFEHLSKYGTDKKERKEIMLRDYQKDAINKWLANGNRGIFEMATGTGKTYTALFAVKQFLSISKENFLLIICCPYQHLVDQWEDNVRDVFPGEEIVKCYDNRQDWDRPLNKLLQGMIYGGGRSGIVVTTTFTGSSDYFRKIVNTNKIKKIVIADEVHNIGAEHNKKFLEIKSDARIGLSATPIRRYDEEGNKAISEYFGSSIYELSIKEAIAMGFLVPYRFFVSICELNDSEYDEYKKLSIIIAQLYSRGNPDEDRLQYLLRQRSQIISTCSSKLVALRQILSNLNDYYNTLIYTAENKNFFDETINILEQMNIVTLKITADINKADRRDVIEKFTKKDIHCILAMRCLDEGVDIPSADKAIILASSTNSKQYIQRRGRVLRRDKEGKKKSADIYDFLVAPPEFVSQIDKDLFERELKRVLEFASTANNYNAVHDIINFSRKNMIMKNFINILQEYTL